LPNNQDTLLIFEGSPIQPIAFDVILSNDIATKFAGRSTFIQAVEDTVKQFYITAGQFLQTWTPPAPRVENQKDIHELDDLEVLENAEITVPKS
jgi:hypothetical protein